MTLRHLVDSAYATLVEEYRSLGLPLHEAIDRVEKLIRPPDPERDRREAEIATARAHEGMHGLIALPAGWKPKRREVTA